MIAVSDSSPLITLAKIGHFEILRQLFGSIIITPEVYSEVTTTGKGLTGATETSAAGSIQIKPLYNQAALANGLRKFGIGAGELSTILLAKEINADLIILDDRRARRVAEKRA